MYGYAGYSLVKHTRPRHLYFFFSERPRRCYIKAFSSGLNSKCVVRDLTVSVVDPSEVANAGRISFFVLL